MLLVKFREAFQEQVRRQARVSAAVGGDRDHDVRLGAGGAWVVVGGRARRGREEPGRERARADVVAMDAERDPERLCAPRALVESGAGEQADDPAEAASSGVACAGGDPE